jgi:protein-disulfide isomerase
MTHSQVNRSLLLVALAFACKPGGAAQSKNDSALSARRDTASVATTAPATTDSIITRADLARIQGSPSAPVWVIVVSDFQCPYCKQWHDQTFATFRDQFVKTGKVRLAYVNFPLNSHVFAWPAAEAAMCAGAQGKFWEMHDALFTNQNQWESVPNPAMVFDSLARSVGVNADTWRACVASGKMKPLIQADHDRAARAGASATPSFMIGDRILAGVQSVDELRVAVDSALAQSKKTSP